MDHNIYDNDFEEFLKQKSDQYKMYPSDRVWNNVYSSLHGRRKWWTLGFTLFFIGAGLLVGREVLLSNYNRMATQLNQGTETLSVTKSVKNSTPYNTWHYLPAAPIVSSAGRSVVNSITTIQKSQENNITRISIPATIITANKTGIEEAAITPETAMVIENDLLPAVPAMRGNSSPVASFFVPQKKLVLNESLTGKSNSSKVETTSPINQTDNAAAEVITPSRWSLQFYASPTISYRRLSTLNQQGDNYVPVAANYAGNINNYVHHKPAPGFELGSNVQYKLSNSLSVFAGAQLNYSRYYINAYKYHTEKASIALKNNSPVRDTLSGYTDIRNFSGYAPEQLQNKYLQLSLPVGIEIKLLGEKNLQFSVAGGIQPTFLLTSTSYLISSDYKNYIQSPDLARGFNVHTNFEAFISYKASGLKWQIGPQFRSQLLSSYSNQYRVREYLTEYGIKFAVTRSF
jgi:hypothetical protein